VEFGGSSWYLEGVVGVKRGEIMRGREWGDEAS
jgi:hypothetical protein